MAEREKVALLLQVLIEGLQPLQAAPGYGDKKAQRHEQGEARGKREQMHRPNEELAQDRSARVCW
jgi:hypothetical protein